MFFVYIIQSQKDKSFYIGSTGAITERLNEHNFGITRYTKNKRPWEIVYFEEYKIRGEAVIRERYLKKQKSKAFLIELIKSRSFKGP